MKMEGKDGDVKWVSVYRPGLIDYIGQEYYDNANNSQKKYAAKFPILVSIDPSTPMSIDDIKPFFKVKRSNDDGSQRSYTIFKLVGMQTSNIKDRYIPIYAKVNARGYHVDGYDFYEYGSARIQDQEYFPSVDLIIQSANQTQENIDRYKAAYGEQYVTIAMALADSPNIGPEYEPSERWIGAPAEIKTYAPIKENLAAPKSSQTINIYAGTNENADLSNFAERPFYPSSAFVKGNFRTVEGAFQAQKLGVLYNTKYDTPYHGEAGEILKKLENATGPEARAIGKTIQGLDVSKWNKNSYGEMKSLIRDSFKQNPQSMKRLVETGTARLTHKQDKGKWGVDFPKILMELREEFAEELNFGKKSGLQAGQMYSADQIHEAYKNMPEYEQFKELAEMVFATAKQFNIKFEAINEPEDHRAGRNMKGDHVQYNLARLKSSTLLHEAIHVCTSYWMEQYDDAPQNVKEALHELKICYEIVQDEYAKSGEDLPYGLTQFKEFVAELSNPNLIKIIKKVDADLEEQGRKQSIIDRIVSAIFTLFNINKQYDSIESTAKNALKQLITTVDKDLYGQHYEKYERLREESSDDDQELSPIEQLKQQLKSLGEEMLETKCTR